MKSLDMHIAQRLKQLRCKRNESAERLALLIGVTLERYAAFENGKRAVPATVLLDLAVYFGLPVTYFLAGYETPDSCRVLPAHNQRKHNRND